MATTKFLGTAITKFLGTTTLKFLDTGGQTATPTIQSASIFFNGVNFTVEWVVKNNDSSSALIMSEINDDTPDISRGTIASNGNTDFILQSSIVSAATIYATAEASGKTLSALASVTVEV
jgi:hypothetical protein